MTVLNKQIVLISAQSSARIGQHVGEFRLRCGGREHPKASAKDLFRAGFVDLSQMKLPVGWHDAVENLEFIEPPVVLLNRANESHAAAGTNRHAKPGGLG